MDFWQFWAARNISRANCTKIATDRPRQAACEIFSIDRRFQRSKSRPSRFKVTCAERHQSTAPPKSHYFTVKMVADKHRYAAYQQALATSFLVVSTSTNLKDTELPK